MARSPSSSTARKRNHTTRPNEDGAHPSIPRSQPKRKQNAGQDGIPIPTLLQFAQDHLQQQQNPTSSTASSADGRQIDKGSLSVMRFNQGSWKTQDTQEDPTGEEVPGASQPGNVAENDNDNNNDDNDEEEMMFSALGQALFTAASLSMLHFTLDLLVRHQYAQDIDWSEMRWKTGKAFPVIFLLVLLTTYLQRRSSARSISQRPSHSLSHSLSSSSSSSSSSPTSSLVQLLFFTLSLGAGCYLVHATNVQGYFAVMKRAPPVGTLWVWSVIELKLPWAVVSVLGTGVWFWWGGYSIF